MIGGQRTSTASEISECGDRSSWQDVIQAQPLPCYKSYTELIGLVEVMSLTHLMKIEGHNSRDAVMENSQYILTADKDEGSS